MDARTKPRRTRRSARPVDKHERAPAPVRDEDAALIRQLVSELRHNDENAERLRAILRAALKERRGPTIAEMLNAGPDISGPEFDAVFEEIERFRHHPVMMQVRDIDL
jgi:hypothetical protein